MTQPQHARERNSTAWSGARFFGKALSFWLLPSAALVTGVEHIGHDTHAKTSVSQADQPPDDSVTPVGRR